MTFGEWLASRDWTATGTWIAATIAAISAFVTLWWPWYTRKQPILTAELTALSMSKEQISKAIIACNLQRPTRSWKIRNDGDGVAFNVEIKTPEGYEARFLKLEKSDEITLSSREASLHPGDERVVVFYPLTTQEVVSPTLETKWAESPIRLRQNHKRKDFAVPGKLRGMSPLGAQEMTLVQHQITRAAGLFGYTYGQMLEILGYTTEDISRALRRAPTTGE
ncbi:hypothetical protein [Leucobacter sp. G161]|uniref:hypothetical protein n=1 Tax=Leucobacter sp. G161 TaxID=663704 RepID=UPI00073CEC78|nr:hypothetical protein [Leucobacter sp. G161]KUF07248.1 hypothetical protein AUL38_10265 [Leucobacter sp. G161]